MKIMQGAVATCLVLLTACSAAIDREGTPAGSSPTVNGSAAEKEAAPAVTLSPGPASSDPIPLSRRWKVVDNAPLIAAAGLTDVVATSPRDAWALGFENAAEDRDGEPVMVHWNGVRWSRFPLPRGIDATELDARAPDDLWVIGGGRVAHWDGHMWSMRAPFGLAQDLLDVAADRDRTVLIGQDVAGSFVSVVEDHTYSLAMTDENSAFTAVDASGGHTWIVGEQPRPDCGGITPAISHNQGGAQPGWRRMRVPDVPGGTLKHVVAVDPTDVWAVGDVLTGSVTTRYADGACPTPLQDRADLPSAPLVMHWDGREWTRMTLPPLRASLSAVTALGPDDVWVLGAELDRPWQPVLLHFDGRQWTLERTYKGRLEALAAVPGGKDIWAVGRPVEYTDYGRETILRRDGRFAQPRP
ncbi:MULTISPECIES: hypothetical protein [unclassified Nonomuraea]|uniref:hypothetical protein n=1 Tax=unclassified Nonomuraea TaxID=2593643 RepID=UPI0033E1C99B